MRLAPTPTPSPAPPGGGGFLPPGAMDFSATGVPWADFLIDALVVAVMVCAGVYGAYAMHLKPLLAKIAKNAATAAEQTANSHADAEYPNLRDNLDALLAEVRAQGQGQEHIRSQIDALAEGQKRQDQELGNIQTSLASDREATRRVDAKIDTHIEQKRDFGARLAEVERQVKIHRKNTE